MNDGKFLTGKHTDGYVRGFECKYRLIKALYEAFNGQLWVSNCIQDMSITELHFVDVNSRIFFAMSQQQLCYRHGSSITIEVNSGCHHDDNADVSSQF